MKLVIGQGAVTFAHVSQAGFDIGVEPFWAEIEAVWPDPSPELSALAEKGFIDVIPSESSNVFHHRSLAALACFHTMKNRSKTPCG